MLVYAARVVSGVLSPGDEFLALRYVPIADLPALAPWAVRVLAGVVGIPSLGVTGSDSVSPKSPGPARGSWHGICQNGLAFPGGVAYVGA